MMMMMMMMMATGAVLLYYFMGERDDTNRTKEKNGDLIPCVVSRVILPYLLTMMSVAHCDVRVDSSLIYIS